ncbi:MAG: hypothetical protein ALECFALPRED_003692 [Alectoria fallacina]|uniref:Uncharacterized protein n=1 Tax=Alectoria fallacina TaxID=1903189 RepID=A0A8H3FU41_9LECA|nr:MAG: hypothetical protein ALECFALPRED_003692 [Alectoria fallacina]
MSWTLLIEVLVLPVIASCAILPQPLDTNDLLRGPFISPALSLSVNLSTVTGNTSSGNLLKLRCDPVRYGRNLNVESCRKVFGFIAQDDTQTVFAERGIVQPHDLNLPFRATSNDARCYVQPILTEGAVTARASPREVGEAAYTLFQECVVKRGVGGIVGDIGGDNHLDVIIASYKPNVHCNSFPGPPWRSCIGLFSDMHADKNRQTFGHLPDPRVQVRLPIAYRAGKILHPQAIRAGLSTCIADRRCTVKIDITGQPTGLSWYEVWEAVVALASTCVRGRQKCGKATGLGLGRNVYLQLSDENPDADIEPLSVGSQNSSLLTSG